MDKTDLDKLLQRSDKFIGCYLNISTKDTTGIIYNTDFKFINITFHGFNEPGFQTNYKPYAYLISDTGERLSEPLLEVVIHFEK